MIFTYSVKETVDNTKFMLQFYICQAFGVSYLSFNQVCQVCNDLDMDCNIQAERQLTEEYTIV